MQDIYVGTSGFSYKHWENGIFYPKGLAREKQLEYYSGIFNSLELNASFYYLPPKEIFEQWRERTPDGFVFAVKANRFITHIKLLKKAKEPWKKFVNNAIGLKEKLGPILFQMPPSFSATKENIKRLDDFTSEILNQSIDGKKLRYSFEFRHPSWLLEEIYKILEEKNIAFCMADSPTLPKVEEITADFLYIRMHGNESLYSSKYKDDELFQLAKQIISAQKEYFKEHDKRLSAYIYFNNDAYGYAPQNAKTLVNMLAKAKKELEEQNNVF
ncbi:DUF72 domain-containing protein [bacterium]|nr:DUF72 domain-containing protein [bacterium]